MEKDGNLIGQNMFMKTIRLLQVIEGFCDTIGKARNRKGGTT